MNEEIKIIIILVNYNSTEDSIECIKSILENTGENFQIIVIDNSDKENNLIELSNKLVDPQNIVTTNFDEFLKKHYTQKIVLVKEVPNKGFAHANNIGLKYIKKFEENHDVFVWLLNNDTVIKPNTIELIFSEIDKIKNNFNANYDLLGTPLMEYNDKRKMQALGGVYYKTKGTTTHLGENIEVENAAAFFNENSTKIDYPIGASMIIHNSFLKEVGFLNEEYFLFFEELDWISRAKQKGGKLILLPIFEIFHKQGESTKAKTNQKKSDFIYLTSYKSRLLYAKNYNKKNLNKIRFNILFLSSLNRMLSGNFKIIPKIIKLVIKGV